MANLNSTLLSIGSSTFEMPIYISLIVQPLLASTSLPSTALTPSCVNLTYTETERVLATISQLSGILSLTIWLFAQLPQIIENYINRSVNGVSLSFLSCWIGGDATNLIGCILTGALPFQTCLAAYYCFVDFILSFQFWYYTRVYPKQKIHHNLLQSPNMLRPTTSNSTGNHRTPRFNRFENSLHELEGYPIDIRSSRSNGNHRKGSFIHKILSSSILSSSFAKPANAMPISNLKISEETSKLDKFHDYLLVLWSSSIQPILISVKNHFYNKESVGETSAWLCSFLYLCSRSPQIYKNYKLKSTKGISPYLFVFAMLGNSFYTISIITDLYLLYYHQETLINSKYNQIFMSQLPFIVGSSGTVLFDCIILLQIWYYKNHNHQSIPEIPNDDLNGYFNHDLHINEQHNNNKHNKKDKIKKKNQSRRRKSNLSSKTSSPFKSNWYNNDNAIDEDQDSDGSFYTNHYNAYSHSVLTNKRTPYLNNLNSSNLINNYDEHNEHNKHFDETSSLLNSQRNNADISYTLTPPPPHYISTSSSIHKTLSNNNINNKPSKKFISNTISAIAKSLPRSNSFIHTRSPNSTNSSYNGSNHHLIMSSLNTNSINVKQMQYESPLDTSLIPSIIGINSSISKKMNDSSKIPFSPIDFLNDDFASANH